MNEHSRASLPHVLLYSSRLAEASLHSKHAQTLVSQASFSSRVECVAPEEQEVKMKLRRDEKHGAGVYTWPDGQQTWNLSDAAGSDFFSHVVLVSSDITTLWNLQIH